MYSNDMIPPWVGTDKPLELFRDAEPIERPVDQTTLTERYTEEATRFIRSSGNSPFFLYLPHSMPHLPVLTSERFRGTSQGGHYGDVIETIDWSMGQILETLKDEGIDDNTMVVFTSDNGPWLDLPARMLAGGVEPWHAGSPGPLRGWKGNTYEGGQRVPCIARWPGRIPAGQMTAELGSAMDLYTTIIETAGGRVPDDRVVDGRNLMPMLTDGQPSPHDEFFYCRGDNLEGMRDGKWKLRLSRHVRDDLAEGEPVTPELFNLADDVSERYDLAEAHPEIAARLESRLRAFGQELGAKMAEPTGRRLQE
jgi:arylsulfatase A